MPTVNSISLGTQVDKRDRRCGRGSVSQVSGLGGLTKGAGANGIPVTVKGTTQNPQFLPDMGGLVKNVNPLGNATKPDVGGIVGGLFGKKKPK